MRVPLGVLGLALAAGLGASVAGASVSAGGPSAARLQAFDGCPSFLAYVRKQALPLVGPWGLGGVVGIAAGPPGAARDAVAGPTGGEPEFSGTNVQEEGVDEPDLVKTDGRTLFVASDGRVSALDVRGGGRPKLVDTLRLERGADELLLSGGHLLVLSRGAAAPIPIDGARDPCAVPVPCEDRYRRARRPRPLRACAVVPDARARRRLPRRAARGTAQRGSCSPRRSVSTCRSWARRRRCRGRRGCRHASRTATSSARPARAAWLPGFTLREAAGKVRWRRAPRPVPPHPAAAQRSPGSASLTVLTFDVARGPRPQSTRTRSSRTAASSTRRRSSLYVATDRYDARPVRADAGPADGVDDRDPPLRHLEPERDRVPRAAAACRDTLLSQWSLSEQDGVLRVASTERADLVGRRRGRRARASVTTLGERGDALVQLGQRRRARQGRAGLRRALHRRRRLRRHLPPGRPALHARPLGALASERSAAS